MVGSSVTIGDRVTIGHDRSSSVTIGHHRSSSVIMTKTTVVYSLEGFRDQFRQRLNERLGSSSLSAKFSDSTFYRWRKELNIQPPYTAEDGTLLIKYVCHLRAGCSSARAKQNAKSELFKMKNRRKPND